MYLKLVTGIVVMVDLEVHLAVLFMSNHLDYIIYLANSEPPAMLYSEGEYCLPELPVVQNRGEENETAYQALDMDSTDYTSMYSKVQESCKQQTPTVESTYQ